MPFIALRRQDLGTRWVNEGEHVPEADTWPNVDVWVRTGWVKFVDELPKPVGPVDEELINGVQVPSVGFVMRHGYSEAAARAINLEQRERAGVAKPNERKAFEAWLAEHDAEELRVKLAADAAALALEASKVEAGATAAGDTALAAEAAATVATAEALQEKLDAPPAEIPADGPPSPAVVGSSTEPEGSTPATSAAPATPADPEDAPAPMTTSDDDLPFVPPDLEPLPESEPTPPPRAPTPSPTQSRRRNR